MFLCSYDIIYLSSFFAFSMHRKKKLFIEMFHDMNLEKNNICYLRVKDYLTSNK